MKTNTKKSLRFTRQQKRQALRTNALPAIRQLVKRFDLPAVQAAVKMLYDERRAEKELHDAERKVESLKRKLGV